VYKPRGITSTDVVACIKRVIGTWSNSSSCSHLNLGNKHKVGHGGTLDPDAEGVLVIGVGSSCKDLHQNFLHDTKV
jgi:tRNA pseudouridine55 synthase